MNLDDKTKQSVRKLGKAINSAIEKSPEVIEAIENLRAMGYEPNLNLRLEIGLQESAEQPDFAENQEVELQLTDEDLKTLQRMKIKI